MADLKKNKKADLKADKMPEKGNGRMPGLVPAVIQDFKSGTVLMLAYMSRESLKKTVETGTTWFYSRSRKKLWNKGETSGNVQTVKEIRYDCDADALLIKVQQTGAACHTGNESCFFNILAGKQEKIERVIKKLAVFNPEHNEKTSDKRRAGELEILGEIYSVASERIKNKTEGSYTYLLHKKGLDEILKKIGEESIEIVLSSKHQTKERTVSEIADLLYHLTVLMVEKGISLKDVGSELEKRRK